MVNLGRAYIKNHFLKSPKSKNYKTFLGCFVFMSRIKTQT